MDTTRRADARRNQQQLLSVARDTFVELGAGAPLDVVARRAGVGIGTLYRHFGDREGLLRAVVVDALESSREAAVAAGEDHEVGFDAVAAYLHAVLDLRVSAVVPVALHRLDLDDEVIGPVREASYRAVQALVDRAHRDGSLPQDVAFADLGTMLVRLSRPLPGRVDAAVDIMLAHRQLELLLAGVVAADRPALSGRRITRAELRSFRS